MKKPQLIARGLFATRYIRLDFLILASRGFVSIHYIQQILRLPLDKKLLSVEKNTMTIEFILRYSNINH